MKEAKRFKVVECSGTPYQIGRQYGESCRDNIHQSVEMSFEGLMYGLKVSREGVIVNANKFFPAVKVFDPGLIDFLKGMSEGAGISFEEAFSLRCMLELNLYYNKIAGLCTSFAATGEATRNGKTILGQNVDSFPGFPLDLLKISHVDGLAQLTLTLGGVMEYTLSSAGFGLCANSILTPVEDYHLNIPAGCYIPRVMRQRTIGDALGILCQTARGVGYYHLAGADGDIIGLESVFDDLDVLHPENDILVHSNHYLTERFKKGDLVAFLLPDSYLRANRIKRLMERRHGDITPETMMEILADHNNYPDSICRHVDEKKPAKFHSETLASVIMVPGERKVYIAYGNPCLYEYLEYNL